MRKYYSSQYIPDLRTIFYLPELCDLLTDLGGGLVILSETFSEKNEQGFFETTFGVRLQSDDHLVTLREKIADKMGWASWKPISESLFEASDLNLFDEKGMVNDKPLLFEGFPRLVNDAGMNLEWELTQTGENLFTKSISELKLKPEILQRLQNTKIKSVMDLVYVLNRGQQFFFQFQDFDETLFHELIQNLVDNGYWPDEGDKSIYDLSFNSSRALWSLEPYGILTASKLVALVNEKGFDFFVEKLHFDDQALNNLKEVLKTI